MDLRLIPEYSQVVPEYPPLKTYRVPLKYPKHPLKWSHKKSKVISDCPQSNPWVPKRTPVYPQRHPKLPLRWPQSTPNFNSQYLYSLNILQHLYSCQQLLKLANWSELGTAQTPASSLPNHSVRYDPIQRTPTSDRHGYNHWPGVLPTVLVELWSKLNKNNDKD